MNGFSRERRTVVVGAGVAGLATALALAPQPVLVLSKRELGAGTASKWAQGGIAAAIGEDDSPELHAMDTLDAGAGINDAHAVEVLTREAPARILDLLELGAKFDRDPGGEFDLGREGAHRRRRILHRGDATGRALVSTLIAAVRRTPSIEVLEGFSADELTVHDGRVLGVRGFCEGERLSAQGRAVVLATGGIGALYRYTTNPLDACGEGVAMAATAGATLADLEFVQFHPTALDAGRDPMPLITEALRGEGALVVDDRGRRFLLEADERGELAPRDVVARAIYAARARGRRTFVDARRVAKEAFPERFPTVFRLCLESGIDPRVDLIPVAPAAHYHMGGIAVDEWGHSSLDGLWACGEVGATGVHGANRLASNSLLEALVFAVRVARSIEARAPDAMRPAPSAGHDRRDSSARETARNETIVESRRVMYDMVGVIRDETGLCTAIEYFGRLEQEAPALRNRWLVSRLIAQAAYDRPESRGSHIRSDHPQTEAAFAHRSFVSTE